MWRGGLSYRRVWVLVRHLPTESWTQTALRDDPKLASLAPAESDEKKFGPWKLENHQLAALHDAIANLQYLTAVLGQVKDAKPPEPMPRPGLRAKREAERPRLPEAAVLYLDKLRARG